MHFYIQSFNNFFFLFSKGGSNNNNYANVDLIVSIAKQHKVEAVWAGWGHASENPKLPASLSKAGIMFMGPSEGAMWMLGMYFGFW